MTHSFAYWQPIIISLTGIIIACAAGIFNFWLLQRLIQKTFRRQTGYLRVFYSHWQKPLWATCIILYLQATSSLLDLPALVATYYNHALNLATTFLITWLIVQLLYTLRDIAIYKHFGPKNKNNLHARRAFTKIDVLLKIAIFIVALVGIALALMTFPSIRKLSLSILASAGIFGIILGIAAKPSFGSIFAGIQIAFTQPIRINDEVVIEGEWGTIEEITLTYVVLRTWDSRRLIVPINYFLENIFQNWTHSTTELIGSVFIELDHSLPIAKIRTALDEILANTPLWDGQVKNLAVTNIKAQSVEIRILASAANASNSWDLRCYIREKLLEYIQRHFLSALPQSRIKIIR